jgi:hypothetical protein
MAKVNEVLLSEFDLSPVPPLAGGCAFACQGSAVAANAKIKRIANKSVRGLSCISLVAWRHKLGALP